MIVHRPSIMGEPAGQVHAQGARAQAQRGGVIRHKQIVRRRVDAEDCARFGDLPPLLARIYASRGVPSPAALDRGLGALVSHERMGGCEEAVALLCAAIDLGQRILVVADFDADGATSCALAVRVLRCMGAEVEYLVPNRFQFGYGLTPEIVDLAVARKPGLIVTVDNGISSVDGVAAARDAGIRVLVTDHHLPGNRLPAADAIVNPNCLDNPFPSGNIAGVGVIFYVLAALRARLRALDWFVQRGLQEPNLADHLDLVALGTVADVVPLDQNNRILVQQGLQRIRAGRCVPGIRGLLEVSGRSTASVSAADLGFLVGPRLNAAGRLDDMSIGIECLLEDDPGRAYRLACQLDALNRERRSIEAGMEEQALETVAAPQLDGDLPVALALFDERWHQGVVGILAARLRERYHRPAIAFAPGEAGEIKGSARSIPGLHMRDLLDRVASAHPGLLCKFGGHAMAAGLSIAADAFGRFAAAFTEVVADSLQPGQLDEVVRSDGPLEDRALTLETAEMIREAGPWGQMFPEPVFDGVFDVIEHRTVGERHLKLVLSTPLGKQVDGIAFRQADRVAAFAGLERIHAAYRLDVNEFRGRRTLQLVVDYLEPAAGGADGEPSGAPGARSAGGQGTMGEVS